MENYQFDNDLMQQGWEKMNVILDQEMPVRKKRRWALVWWQTSAIAASLLLGFAFIFYKNQTTKSLASNQELSSATIASTSTETKTKNEDNHATKVTLNPKNEVSNQNSATTIYDKKIKNINVPIVFKTLDNHVKVENLDLNKTISLEKNTNAQSSDNRVSYEKLATEVQSISLQKQREATFIPSIQRLKSTTLDVSLAEKKPDYVAIKKPNLLKTNQLHIGIFASLLQSKYHFASGYQVGLTLQKTWKKHSISLNGFLEKSNRYVKIFTNSNQVSSSYPPNNCLCDLVYPYYSNSILGTSTTPNSTTGSSFLSNYHFAVKDNKIGISLEYAYRFRPHWEMMGGLEYLSSLSSFSYTYEENNYSVFLKDADLNMGSKNVSGTNKYSEIFSKESWIAKNTLNLNVGFSYFFKKNIKTTLLYRVGLQDITPSDQLNYFERNNYVSLRGMYYF
jgi:hypothetical protein